MNNPQNRIALINDLDRKLQDAQQLNVNLEAALQQLQDQFNEQLTQNEQLQQQNTQLTDEINDSAQLLTKAASQTETHIHQINQLRIKNDALQNELKTKLQAKQTTERALEQAVIQLNGNQQMIQETDVQFNQQILVQKTELLQSENNAQKVLIGEYENNINQLKQKIKQLEVEKFDLQANQDLITENLNNNTEIINDQQIQIQQLINENRRNVELNNSFTSIQMSNLSHLDQNKVNIEMQRLQLQVQNYQEQSQKQLAQITENQNAVLELKNKNQLQEMQNQSNLKQIQQLKEKIIMLNKNFQMEKEIFGKHIAQLDRINEKLSNQSQPQTQDLIGQYKNFVIEMQDRFQSKQPNRASQYYPAEQIIQQPSAHNEILQHEIAQLKDINIKYVNQIKQLHGELQSMQEQILQYELKENSIQLERQQLEKEKLQLKLKDEEIIQIKQKMNENKQRYKNSVTQQKQMYEQTINKYQQILNQQQKGRHMDVNQMQKNVIQQKLVTQISDIVNKLDDKQNTNQNTQQDDQLLKYQNVLNKKNTQVKNKQSDAIQKTTKE